MGAVAQDAELAAGAPDFAAEEMLRPLDDHAGIVAAGRARPDRVWHGAHDRLRVACIHAGASDLDDRGAFGDAFSGVDFDQLQSGVERLGAGRLRLNADGEAVLAGEGGGGIVHGRKSPVR